MKKTMLRGVTCFALMSSLSADFIVRANENKCSTTENVLSEPQVRYDNRINFGPSRFGYEWLKPEKMYFGIDFWYIMTYGPIPFERTIGEVEARVGYNMFLNNQDRLTPIVGAGFFKDFVHHQKQALVYGTLGVLYEHQFNNDFDLGVNVKVLGGSSIKRRRWGNPIWGCDLSVPFTFHFGKNRNWDFRLEPFYIQMFGHNHSHSFGGGRSAFGYSF